MRCVYGCRSDLSQSQLDDIGRYRRKVFVERLGWTLEASGDVELDEFDGGKAVYVSTFDGAGRICGVARLLPTTTPYLLAQVFPCLWGDGALPQHPEVWELSRFAAVDLYDDEAASHQAAARHARTFLSEVLQVARRHGARSVVTVSPVGMERLLRANGFNAARAGIPRVCDGSLLTALKLDLDRLETSKQHSQRA